jgi:pSer/pThr/pTyr-binding forkhead associated (FHA) protein
VPDGDEWFFTDHGSTNGSCINDQVLVRGDKYPLREGDHLQLGLEVAFDFLGPRALYMKTR